MTFNVAGSGPGSQWYVHTVVRDQDTPSRGNYRSRLIPAWYRIVACHADLASIS